MLIRENAVSFRVFMCLRCFVDRFLCSLKKLSTNYTKYTEVLTCEV